MLVSGWLWAALTASWLGILTSLSPCPLATNITAISFVGRRTGSPRGVLLAGLLYALGRTAVYVLIGTLLVSSLLSASSVSIALQAWMNKILGPLLILVGMVMLDLLRVTLKGRGFGARFQQRVERWGILGALALGVVFALTFCPVSAALFFGSLIPLSIQHGSGVVLPFLFGIGTALPVIVVSVLLASGARFLGSLFSKMTQVERWMRWATGAVFVGVGIYLSLTHIYGVL
ncbi:MAG: aromatic aminobenezylarsenical efflux permease ArsG family transporter [Candidatus Bipolaricaulota bacterium]|nr:aromatic aminobenezylarsenical efflux permease ArsG family transporter [Candidatus Bipolaricaulota bacterium]